MISAGNSVRRPRAAAQQPQRWPGGMMEYVTCVLAVEPKPTDARDLARCLKELGLRFRLAHSAEEAMHVLRSAVFDGAVVAVELYLGPEPMLARLARLPATKVLVATGPAADFDAERRARTAGATAYLPRPVSTEALSINLTCMPVQAPETPAMAHSPPEAGRSPEEMDRSPPPADPGGAGSRDPTAASE